MTRSNPATLIWGMDMMGSELHMKMVMLPPTNVSKGTVKKVNELLWPKYKSEATYDNDGRFKYINDGFVSIKKLSKTTESRGTLKLVRTVLLMIVIPPET
jgi:hypothetical protein